MSKLLEEKHKFRSGCRTNQKHLHYVNEQHLFMYLNVRHKLVDYKLTTILFIQKENRTLSKISLAVTSSNIIVTITTISTTCTKAHFVRPARRSAIDHCVWQPTNALTVFVAETTV